MCEVTGWNMPVPWLWRQPRVGGIYQLDPPEDHVIDTESETGNFRQTLTHAQLPIVCVFIIQRGT